MSWVRTAARSVASANFSMKPISLSARASTPSSSSEKMTIDVFIRQRNSSNRMVTRETQGATLGAEDNALPVQTVDPGHFLARTALTGYLPQIHHHVPAHRNF